MTSRSQRSSCPVVRTRTWDVHLKCYLPESALEKHRHADLYRQFQAGGWLTLTPGEIVDYRFLETDLAALARRLPIRAVHIDARFQGVQVATNLKERGLDVREMSQTHAAYAAPMRELERLVKDGRLHHGGNPVLRWAIDHLVVDIDSNGDAKPSKIRGHEKIDPVVGVLMALDLAIRQGPQREPQIMVFGGLR